MLLQTAPDAAWNIVRIPQRVDDIPLAIELAASQLRGMRPVQLLARLDEQLASSRESKVARSA